MGRDVSDERTREHVNGIVAAALRWTRAGGAAWRLGRHSAYRLPWYLVIGETGAGKSTMLHAAGLRRVNRSAPAARECDQPPVRAWFGKEAVLFETTVGDAAHEGGWRALIRRLRRVRRGCPANGIVIAVAAYRLMGVEAEARADVDVDADVDDGWRARYAEALRDCIDECYRQWKRRVPVYVVVTQCDRLTGFDAFVGDLTDEARARALGVALPLDEGSRGDGWLAHFSRSFETLMSQAQAQVIARMPVRSDPWRAAMTFAFPKAWEALGAPLAAFLREAVEASPSRPESLFLRSVHFTARHEAVPALSQHAPQPLHSARGAARACFVDGFVRESLLRERGLAVSRHAMPHRRLIVSRVAAALCAVSMACAALGLVEAYRRGGAAIVATAPPAAALAQAARAGIDPRSARAILALLDRARGLPCDGAWHGPGSPSIGRLWRLRDTHLEAACRAAYRTVLRETLQPYVLSRMAQSLRDAGQAPSARFDTLRAYLMLGDKRHYERAVVLAWIEDDASRTGLSSSERAAWRAHCEAWADPAVFESDAPLDAKLVAQARASLRAQPQAQRVFDAVMPALHEAMPDALSVADMAGPGAALALYRKSGALLSDGVPGSYTRAGMRRYYALRDAAVEQARRDGWVLGQAHADAQGAQWPTTLTQEVDRLYFTAYVQAWDAVLDDVGLRPLPRSDDGAALVSLLAGHESPLRAFLARAAKETTLATAATDPDVVPSRPGLVDSAARRVHQWFGTVKPAALIRAEASSEAASLVDRHFEALHRLANGASAGAGAKSPLDEVQAQLKEVAVYLRAAGVARASGLPAPADDALERLHESAAAMPAPLGDMLGALAQRGASAAQSAERARIDQQWRAEVGGFCRAAIGGRYPFFPDGSGEVTPADFTRLFAAGGLLDTFFQAYLKPYADTSTVPWRWRARVAPPGMSVSALREFERAARIREAFFSGQGKTMDVRFTLTPRGMDAGLTRFVLASGGQVLDYAHDPPRATTFDWPDRAGERAARVDYAPASADGRHGFEAQGAWSLLRLLDEGRLDARSADRFKLTFLLDGKKVALDLAASSVVNPFSLPALRSFRCPSGF
jgi:type VI secretion system protein ImpL